MADNKQVEYPTSISSDGFIDERACERLGLGAQWKQAVLEERDDGMLLMLSGTGEMLIRAAGKAPCVLNFKETAGLIVFMDGSNTKRLFPAILRASLLTQGGKAAELAERIGAALGKEESASTAPVPEDNDDDVNMGIPIGEIAGETVYADYDGEGQLFGADLAWNGLEIRTDGVQFLELGTGEGTDFYNQMSIQEWGRVKELASTTVVEQLIALARSKSHL
jgi:hypothetical protein